MTKTNSHTKLKEDALVSQTLTHITQQLNSPKRAEAFVHTLLTEKERTIIARRLLTASMIQRGDTYMTINEKLGLSPNTFAKIRRWLKDELPDYQTVLQHTEVATRERARKRQRPNTPSVAPFSYQHLKRNYPAHFLLFNLAEVLFKRKNN